MLAAAATQGVSVFMGLVVGACVIGAVLVGGIIAWREKAGAFYKAVAEEKTAEAQRLREQRDRLAALTDITPILDELKRVVEALDRNTATNEQVFEKVKDMNGGLRATGEAMNALADRLILDEAARGLLAAAADRERRPPA